MEQRISRITLAIAPTVGLACTCPTSPWSSRTESLSRPSCDRASCQPISGSSASTYSSLCLNVIGTVSTFVAPSLSSVSFLSPLHDLEIARLKINRYVQFPAVPRRARVSWLVNVHQLFHLWVIERNGDWPEYDNPVVYLVLISVQRSNSQHDLCHHQRWCALRDKEFLTDGQLRCYLSASDLITLWSCNHFEWYARTTRAL